MANHELGRRSLLRMAASPVLVSIPGLGAGARYLVYCGTYTGGGGQFGNGGSQGIYVSRMDAGTGKLTNPELAAGNPNPSWLVIHPNHGYLYAVNERMETGGKVLPGEVSAFSIDRRTGKLTSVNRVPSRGGQPCHICTDKTGRVAMVANWSTGSEPWITMLLHSEPTTNIVRDAKEFQYLQGFQERLFDFGRTTGFSQECRLFMKLNKGLHVNPFTVSSFNGELRFGWRRLHCQRC